MIAFFILLVLSLIILIGLYITIRHYEKEQEKKYHDNMMFYVRKGGEKNECEKLP